MSTVEPINIPIKLDTSDFEKGSKAYEKINTTFESIKRKAQNLPGEFAPFQSAMEEMESAFGHDMKFDSKTQMKNLPESMHSVFSTMYEVISDQMISVNKELSKTLKGRNFGKEVAENMQKQIAMIYAQMNSAFSAQSDILSAFKSMSKTGNLEAIKASFSDISQSAQSEINNIMRAKQGPISTKEMLSVLKKNQTFGRAFESTSSHFQMSKAVGDSLLKGIIRAYTPVHSQSDFFDDLSRMSNGLIKRPKFAKEITSFRDRMPDRFKNVPLDFSHSNIPKNANYQGRLSSQEYEILKKEAAHNAALERAQIMSGVAQRGVAGGRAGQLIMPSNPISKKRFATVLGHLDKDILRPALEGSPMWHTSIDDPNAYNQRKMGMKTSNIPTQAYSAFHALQNIAQGVAPIYTNNKHNGQSKTYNQTSAVNANTRIRPDMYEIMSQTYGDFVEGKILDEKAPKYSLDEKYARGHSANKMISRSIYTDLLGMHGHNTYGNGSKKDKKNPYMLQLDLSDIIYSKDENGNIQFEQGKPVYNPEAEKLVKSIFAPKSSFSYGDGQKYMFPSIPYGKHGDYVPTNIKNGIITLARKDKYVDVSKSFIEKFGVNVFDNLISSNSEFSSDVEISKPLEARNRIQTPGVPFSEQGGAQPGRNKTAFVDIGAITGLDGASFFMPGYLPGGDLTIRAPGIKGLAQTVDYKQMIRDIYGENIKEFLLPSISAPEKIKEYFKQHGIKATRRLYSSKDTRQEYGLDSVEDFRKHFLNIFDYDALIDSSVVKTPFYKNLSNEQASDLFYSVQEATGGLRGVSTAEDFLSHGGKGLSAQASQFLWMDPKGYEENTRKWQQHINRQRTDFSYVKKQLFSNENDPQTQLLTDETQMESNPDIKKRINDAIEEAELSMFRNEQFADGNAQMAVALANPGEHVLKLGQSNNLELKNRDLAAALSLSGGMIGSKIAALHDNEVLSGFRYPSNLGETEKLTVSQAYNNLIDKYSMSKYGLYANSEVLRRMGGGDFDGDTVQLLMNELAEYAIKASQQSNQSINGYQSQIKTMSGEKFAARKINESDFAKMLYQQVAASFAMSAVSRSSDALSQINWNDEEEAKMYARSGVDLRAMYDIDSTFQKTGIQAEWSKYAQNAKNLGTPFYHQFKHLEGAYNDKDFKKLGDFSKVNFPSIFSGITTSILGNVARIPMSNKMLDYLIASQADLQGIENLKSSPYVFDQNKAAYLEKNNELMAKQIAKGKIPSVEEEDELNSLLTTWQASLTSARLPRGVPLDVIQREKREAKEQEYRLKHLTAFGVSQRNIKANKGYANVLNNNMLSSDQSVFAQIEKNITDEMRAKMALELATNPSMVAAVRNASPATDYKGQMDARNISWSMQKSFEQAEKDPSKLSDWYDINILKNNSLQTPEIHLGKATHEAFENWAKWKMGEIKELPDLENFMLNYLKAYEPKIGDNPFASFVESRKQGALTKEQYSNVQNALSFVRNLPKQFEGWEVLASEETVHPFVNVPKLKGDGMVSTVGRPDIRMKSPDGKIVQFDLKTMTTDRSALDQNAFYQSDPNAKKVDQIGVIGYTSKSEQDYQADMTPNIYLQDYSSEHTKRVVEQAEQTTRRIQNFALSGFDPVTYRDQYLYPGSGSVLEDMRRTRDLVFEERAKEKDEENYRREIEKANEEERRENLAILSEDSANSFAKAMSIRQRADEYADELKSLQGTFRGISFREPGKKPIGNQWERFERLLGMEAASKRQQLSNEGASDEQLENIDIQRQEAEDEFVKARRSAAKNDIKSLLMDFDTRFMGKHVDSNVKQYVSEFDALTEAVDKASQAYESLKKKITNTSDPKAISQEDIKAFEEADQEHKKLIQKREEATKYYEGLAQDDENQKVNNLKLKLSGRTAPMSGVIEQQVQAVQKQIEQSKRGLAEQITKFPSRKEEFEKILSQYDELNQEDYKKTLENDWKNKTHKEVTSFIRHGDRMDLAHRRRAIDNTMYGRYLAQAENELEQRRHYDEMGTLKLEELKNAQAPQTEIDKLTESLNRNKKAMEGLEGARGQLSIGFQILDDVVSKLITRLGKQLLSKAMNELKRFTLEFNANMTEIQAITMKSDEEMADVRKNTLNDAVKYRTSVSNVSSVRKDLYRQGLNDAEVDERSGSILKFAKVTAIKTQDATKIITTAQQNNLVDSAEEAMDALVALGDNAATTATEIGNAMQKCAAAAKVAGVSYSELTPMLATMTSMTQLSGKQVGTAMNTILTRLHNVTANNYTKEINGEVTSLNDVEKALGTIGVSLRDDDGGWRKSTDVLLDIAERWQSMTDIQKSLVSTSVAATRSGNMFQTLMEGMSEDGGETFREYQDLAENSDGITDRKYEVTVRSLASALDTLQSSFDRLVSGLESSGVLPSIVDFFSETLNNVSMLVENIPEIGSAFATIIPTLAVAAGLLVMMRTGATGAGMLVGLGIAGAGLLAASAIGKGVSASNSEVLAAERAEAAQNRFENYKKVNTAKTKYENASSLINESRSLIEKSQELSESMDSAAETKLDECIKQLTLLFPDQVNEIDNANASVNDYTSFQNKASEANDRLLKSEYDRARILANIAAEENFDKYIEENVKDVFFDREDFKGFIDETYSVDVDPALSADYIQDKQAQGYGLKEQFTRQGLTPGNEDDDEFLKAFELLQEYVYGGKSQTEEERELIGKYTTGYNDEGFLFDRFVPTENDAKIIEKKISDLEVEIDSVNQKESDLEHRKPVDEYLKFIMLSEDIKEKEAERLRLSSPETLRALYAGNVSEEIRERFPEAFNGSKSWPLYNYFYNELDAEEIKEKKQSLESEQANYQKAYDVLTSSTVGSYGEVYTNPDIYHFAKANNERFSGSLDIMLNNRVENLDVPFEQEVGMDALYNIQRILDYDTGYSKIKDFNMSVMDDLLSTLFSQGKIEDYDMFSYGNSQEFVDDARTGFNKLRKLEEYDVYVQNIAQAVFDAVENDSLETYFETIDKEVADAYEKAILYFIESYVPEYFANPEADYADKMAIMRALKENAPRKDDGSIDWDTFANKEYLKSHYENAIALVDGESGDNYFRKEDYAYYWDNETFGKGFETLEEAQQYIQTTAQNNPELSSEWVVEQKKKIKHGGESTNAGAVAYYTPGEYADMAFENWLSQNPQYAEDYAKLINIMNESASFAEFEGKISDDTRIAELMNKNDSLNLAWRSAKSGSGSISYDVFKKILLGAYSGQNLLKHDDYMNLLSYGFGEGWEDRIASGEYVVDDEAMERYQTALQDPAFNEYLDQAISKYEGLGEIVKALAGETEQTTDAQKALAEVFRNTALSESQKYNKNLSKITDTLSALSKGGKNAEDAVQDLNQQMKQRDYAQYSLNAFKKGKATSNDLSVLSDFFGIDEEQLKKASKDMGSETSQWLLQSMMAELASYDTDLADVIQSTALADINQALTSFPDIEIPITANGTVDTSALIAALNAAGANINATAAAYACTLSLEANDRQLSVVFNQEGQKRKTGGGGGGKSKTEKFIEELKRKLTTRKHLIKMIQYQETKYENRGEFGNLNRMIALENDAQRDLRSTLEENLASLKKQIASTKQGSDDWYSLREEILATEEAIEDANIAIEENIEKMKENEEAIRQTRIALEEMVNSEIENRIQKERGMLEGSVSMQDMILDSIKQRYQDEWDLVKKDIDKKREALEEEKALIDERLNARKEAEDEAAKYEELAEYNKQLALISMDSTRTKDAAELRNKIAELEKELAWDVAEDEAEAQKQKIDDEITAYDQYVSLGDEDMQAFLEDANNFADEVKNVLGLSHDDLMEWLKTNIKEYTKSLDDAKKQMLQSWDDLYKQMYGITDTYWEEIANILSSKDSFLDYMKESEEYVNASETDRASMLYEWGEAYDDYVAALKQDAEYSHSDEEYGMSSASTSSTGKKKKTTNTIGSLISDGLQNGASNFVQYFTNGQAAKDIENGFRTGLGWVQNALGIKTMGNMIPGFSSGGDVNYTGLAMVHGTPSRPEAFLSADDRIMIRTLIDSFGYARYTPKSFAYDMDNSSASAKIEEVNVTINQAELGSDEDIENTARKVGNVFARELAKAGFNTTKIGF